MWMTLNHNFGRRARLACEHQGGPRLLYMVESVVCAGVISLLRARDQVRTCKGVLSVVRVYIDLAKLESGELLDGGEWNVGCLADFEFCCSIVSTMFDLVMRDETADDLDGNVHQTPIFFHILARVGGLDNIVPLEVMIEWVRNGVNLDPAPT